MWFGIPDYDGYEFSRYADRKLILSFWVGFLSDNPDRDFTSISIKSFFYGPYGIVRVNYIIILVLFFKLVY